MAIQWVSVVGEGRAHVGRKGHGDHCRDLRVGLFDSSHRINLRKAIATIGGWGVKREMRRSVGLLAATVRDETWIQIQVLWQRVRLGLKEGPFGRHAAAALATHPTLARIGRRAASRAGRDWPLSHVPPPAPLHQLKTSLRQGG
jgi:hypothetical protein